MHEHPLTAERHAADLLSRGYHEIQQWGDLRVGDRARHVNQLWPKARTGTATIKRIFHKPNSAWEAKWGRPDVELSLTRDNGEDAFWADYHTEPARKELQP